MLKPTDEQAAAADAFRAGDHLALQAGAGTGKTTTLAQLAHATRRRGRYLAYNRAIAQDATARFPRSVLCKTAHALAYAAVGHRYAHRLNAPRRPAWQTGQALGITKAVRIGERDLSQRTLSNAALRTVARFCHSADPVITRHHVPRLRGLEDRGLHAELAAHIVPFASKAWNDLQHPGDGAVRFDHDHYLKIWSLTVRLLISVSPSVLTWMPCISAGPSAEPVTSDEKAWRHRLRISSAVRREAQGNGCLTCSFLFQSNWILGSATGLASTTDEVLSPVTIIRAA